MGAQEKASLVSAAVERSRVSARGLTFSTLECGSGPLVLFLHGFPDSEHTFESQLQAVAAAGFRGVAVRTRGYEPSSQSTDYHAATLAEDAVAIVEALGESQAHLVGHDWGATIAYAAAAARPEMWKSLAVLSVPHPARFEQEIARSLRQLRRSWYVIWFQFRGWSDRWLRRHHFAAIARLWSAWSPGWTQAATEAARVRRLFAEPGVADAALAYYRTATDRKSEVGRRSREWLLAPVRVPTLGIHGRDDGCIGADVFERAMTRDVFPAGLEVQLIESAGHFVHREQPARVNSLLVEWLKAH